MTIKYLVITLFLSLFTLVNAQKAKTPGEKQYLSVLKARAGKIVDKLDLKSDEEKIKVTNIVAKQYWDVNKIHDGKAALIKEAKAANLTKAKLEKAKAKFEKKADAKLAKTHSKYIKRLNKNLSPEQVDGVKDGMTYGVCPNTYNGYLDMLPDLTEAQKVQIKEWLVEAREHAMDAGSSDEKHKWFGKYKGRINNYLSKEGYDLNKASKEWHERLKAKGIKL